MLYSKQFNQIILKLIKSGELTVFTTDDIVEVIESKCFLAIKEIVAILENHQLSDSECINKIIDYCDELGIDINRNYWLKI